MKEITPDELFLHDFRNRTILHRLPSGGEVSGPISEVNIGVETVMFKVAWIVVRPNQRSVWGKKDQGGNFFGFSRKELLRIVLDWGLVKIYVEGKGLLLILPLGDEPPKPRKQLFEPFKRGTSYRF